MGDMPWAVPSRSVQGRKTEEKIIKGRGGFVHPNSGAGRIKDDGHNRDTNEQYEVKDANKSYTLKGSELLTLFKRAVRRGRTATFIVYFTDADVTATITVEKGRR